MLSLLQKGKNLLAFSAGVDSTALFFLLQEERIDFDLAIVNYHHRAQAKEEVRYAHELALKYGKRLFVHEAPLKGPAFEHRARKIRYDFFECIIRSENYQTLITAHQLNDQLEWFLMQLTKGAGLTELLGMQTVMHKEGYQIVRPLLFVPRREILEYLQKRDIRYFLDATNEMTDFRRNYFRLHFASKLLEEFEEGIKKSFRLLTEERKELLGEVWTIWLKELCILKNLQNPSQNIRHIDKTLKRLGYLISSAQRAEILRTGDSVVGGRFAVCFGGDYIYVAPYLLGTAMPKAFKEWCRRHQIPPKIRPYIYTAGITPDQILKATRTTNS